MTQYNRKNVFITTVDNMMMRWCNRFKIIKYFGQPNILTFDGRPIATLNKPYSDHIEFALEDEKSRIVVVSGWGYNFEFECGDAGTEVIFFDTDDKETGRFMVSDRFGAVVVGCLRRQIIIIDTGFVRAKLYLRPPNRNHWIGVDEVISLFLDLKMLLTIFSSGRWDKISPSHPAHARVWVAPWVVWYDGWDAADEGERSVLERRPLNHRFIEALSWIMPRRWRHMPTKVAAKQRARDWWDAKRHFPVLVEEDRTPVDSEELEDR